MTPKGWISGLIGLCIASAAQGLTLDLPSTTSPSGSQVDAAASYGMPVGPSQEGTVPTLRVEGQVSQQAWRLESHSTTTLQILTPLRDQLLADGFDVIFECETQECGGFDFRYGTQLLPEPVMHVNLSDFRFLSARRTDADGPQHVALMVSRSGQQGFVHLVHVAPADSAPASPKITVSTQSLTPQVALAAPIAAALEETGRAVLADLRFSTGSSQLEDDGYASLSELADYLTQHPTRSIVLVGHTDAEGALDSNIALSKKRASSVRDHLVSVLGVPGDQVMAEGVGFLVPLASNLTDEGRTQNRRVEAILSTTQ